MPLDELIQTEEYYLDGLIHNDHKISYSSTNDKRQYSFFGEDSLINSTLKSPFDDFEYISLLKQIKSIQLQFVEIDLLQQRQQESLINVQQNLVENVKKNRKKKIQGSLKNFLTCLKRCIIQLIGKYLEKIKDKQMQQFLKDKNRSNKLEILNLLMNQEARFYLQDLFSTRAFYRQIQLSMMRKNNRKAYLNELSLLKKAFIQRKLPNL